MVIKETYGIDPATPQIRIFAQKREKYVAGRRGLEKTRRSTRSGDEEKSGSEEGARERTTMSRERIAMVNLQTACVGVAPPATTSKSIRRHTIKYQERSSRTATT